MQQATQKERWCRWRTRRRVTLVVLLLLPPRILDVFHESCDVFQLKDVEKLSVKKGVIAQAVKDVLQVRAGAPRAELVGVGGAAHLVRGAGCPEVHVLHHQPLGTSKPLGAVWDPPGHGPHPGVVLDVCVHW